MPTRDSPAFHLDLSLQLRKLRGLGGLDGRPLRAARAVDRCGFLTALAVEQQSWFEASRKKEKVLCPLGLRTLGTCGPAAIRADAAAFLEDDRGFALRALVQMVSVTIAEVPAPIVDRGHP